MLTAGALYSIDGNVFRPHGNPLLHALALSWLISITAAVTNSALFKMNPELFPLARWENDGKVYDRGSIRAFRWVLLQSPLGWIRIPFDLYPVMLLRRNRGRVCRLLRLAGRDRA